MSPTGASPDVALSPVVVDDSSHREEDAKISAAFTNLSAEQNANFSRILETHAPLLSNFRYSQPKQLPKTDKELVANIHETAKFLTKHPLNIVPKDFIDHLNRALAAKKFIDEEDCLIGGGVAKNILGNIDYADIDITYHLNDYPFNPIDPKSDVIPRDQILEIIAEYILNKYSSVSDPKPAKEHLIAFLKTQVNETRDDKLRSIAMFIPIGGLDLKFIIPNAKRWTVSTAESAFISYKKRCYHFVDHHGRICDAGTSAEYLDHLCKRQYIVYEPEKVEGLIFRILIALPQGFQVPRALITIALEQFKIYFNNTAFDQSSPDASAHPHRTKILANRINTKLDAHLASHLPNEFARKIAFLNLLTLIVQLDENIQEQYIVDLGVAWQSRTFQIAPGKRQPFAEFTSFLMSHSKMTKHLLQVIRGIFFDLSLGAAHGSQSFVFEFADAALPQIGIKFKGRNYFLLLQEQFPQESPFEFMQHFFESLEALENHKPTPELLLILNDLLENPIRQFHAKHALVTGFMRACDGPILCHILQAHFNTASPKRLYAWLQGKFGVLIDPKFFEEKYLLADLWEALLEADRLHSKDKALIVYVRLAINRGVHVVDDLKQCVTGLLEITQEVHFTDTRQRALSKGMMHLILRQPDRRTVLRDFAVFVQLADLAMRKRILRDPEKSQALSILFNHFKPQEQSDTPDDLLRQVNAAREAKALNLPEVETRLTELERDLITRLLSMLEKSREHSSDFKEGTPFEILHSLMHITTWAEESLKELHFPIAKVLAHFTDLFEKVVPFEKHPQMKAIGILLLRIPCRYISPIVKKAIPTLMYHLFKTAETKELGICMARQFKELFVTPEEVTSLREELLVGLYEAMHAKFQKYYDEIIEVLKSYPCHITPEQLANLSKFMVNSGILPFVQLLIPIDAELAQRLSARSLEASDKQVFDSTNVLARIMAPLNDAKQCLKQNQQSDVSANILMFIKRLQEEDLVKLLCKDLHHLKSTIPNLLQLKPPNTSIDTLQQLLIAALDKKLICLLQQPTCLTTIVNHCKANDQDLDRSLKEIVLKELQSVPDDKSYKSILTDFMDICCKKDPKCAVHLFRLAQKCGALDENFEKWCVDWVRSIDSLSDNKPNNHEIEEIIRKFMASPLFKRCSPSTHEVILTFALKKMPFELFANYWSLLNVSDGFHQEVILRISEKILQQKDPRYVALIPRVLPDQAICEHPDLASAVFGQLVHASDIAYLDILMRLLELSILPDKFESYCKFFEFILKCSPTKDKRIAGAKQFCKEAWEEMTYWMMSQSNLETISDLYIKILLINPTFDDLLHSLKIFHTSNVPVEVLFKILLVSSRAPLTREQFNELCKKLCNVLPNLVIGIEPAQINELVLNVAILSDHASPEEGSQLTWTMLDAIASTFKAKSSPQVQEYSGITELFLREAKRLIKAQRIEKLVALDDRAMIFQPHFHLSYYHNFMLVHITNLNEELQKIISSQDEASLKKLDECWQNAERMMPLFGRFMATVTNDKDKSVTSRSYGIEIVERLIFHVLNDSTKVDVNVLLRANKFFELALEHEVFASIFLFTKEKSDPDPKFDINHFGIVMVRISTRIVEAGLDILQPEIHGLLYKRLHALFTDDYVKTCYFQCSPNAFVWRHAQNRFCFDPKKEWFLKVFEAAAGVFDRFLGEFMMTNDSTWILKYMTELIPCICKFLPQTEECKRDFYGVVYFLKKLWDRLESIPKNLAHIIQLTLGRQILNVGKIADALDKLPKYMIKDLPRAFVQHCGIQIQLFHQPPPKTKEALQAFTFQYMRHSHSLKTQKWWRESTTDVSYTPEYSQLIFCMVKTLAELPSFVHASFPNFMTHVLNSLLLDKDCVIGMSYDPSQRAKFDRYVNHIVAPVAKIPALRVHHEMFFLKNYVYLVCSCLMFLEMQKEAMRQACTQNIQFDDFLASIATTRAHNTRGRRFQPTWLSPNFSKLDKLRRKMAPDLERSFLEHFSAVIHLPNPDLTIVLFERCLNTLMKHDPKQVHATQPLQGFGASIDPMEFIEPYKAFKKRLDDHGLLAHWNEVRQQQAQKDKNPPREFVDKVIETLPQLLAENVDEAREIVWETVVHFLFSFYGQTQITSVEQINRAERLLDAAVAQGYYATPTPQPSLKPVSVSDSIAPRLRTIVKGNLMFQTVPPFKIESESKEAHDLMAQRTALEGVVITFALSSSSDQTMQELVFRRLHALKKDGISVQSLLYLITLAFRELLINTLESKKPTDLQRFVDEWIKPLLNGEDIYVLTVMQGVIQLYEPLLTITRILDQIESNHSSSDAETSAITSAVNNLSVKAKQDLIKTVKGKYKTSLDLLLTPTWKAENPPAYVHCLKQLLSLRLHFQKMVSTSPLYVERTFDTRLAAYVYPFVFCDWGQCMTPLMLQEAPPKDVSLIETLKDVFKSFPIVPPLLPSYILLTLATIPRVLNSIQEKVNSNKLHSQKSISECVSFYNQMSKAEHCEFLSKFSEEYFEVQLDIKSINLSQTIKDVFHIVMTTFDKPFSEKNLKARLDKLYEISKHYCLNHKAAKGSDGYLMDLQKVIKLIESVG